MLRLTVSEIFIWNRIHLSSQFHNMSTNTTDTKLREAANAISAAKALIITAGAGMGVDSGLPDFRGSEGFWKAYPPLKHMKINFPSMSSPHWFDKDPNRAWGFFGHRYNLYRSTNPHSGFQILKKWSDKMPNGYFIFTSNVDGHFQKAGFSEERIFECHGSINFLQCVDSDENEQIWPVPDDFKVDVDMSVLQATSPLPRGPPEKNKYLARPNILMFGDYSFVDDRTEKQYERMKIFEQNNLKEPYVVVEIGAGLAVPTVRYQSESFVRDITSRSGKLIRINPAESQVPKGQISLKMKGLEALEKIDAILKEYYD